MLFERVHERTRKNTSLPQLRRKSLGSEKYDSGGCIENVEEERKSSWHQHHHHHRPPAVSFCSSRRLCDLNLDIMINVLYSFFLVYNPR